MAQPRGLQARPTISFRTDRPILEAIDGLAQRFSVTRNDLLETVLRRYLEDRGEDVEAMLAQIGGRDDDSRTQLDIFQ